MPSALAPRWIALLLLAQGACVLSVPQTGELAALRAQQQAQADRVADALCESYYACGCSAMYDLHTNHAECVEQVSTALFQRLEQGINRELEYDPRCLDAHAELFEGLGCSTGDALVLDTALSRLLDEASECRTYHGDLEVDQDCELLVTARGDECGPNLECDAVFGLCVDTTPLPEWSPCSQQGDGPPCAPELVCEWSWAQDVTVCIPPVALGASCAVTGYCEGDAWCDRSDPVCRPLPELGEACLAGLPPRAGCAWGLVCTAGQCTSATSEGSPCYVSCGPGLTCDGGSCIPGRSIVCDAEAWLP